MTDNGGTAGVKTYNAGMRGGKTSVHEGGTRVPLFMKWPAKNWKPYVAKPIVSHIDIFPTLMDLCGVTPPTGPKIDGVSLRPLLEGRESSWPERVLFTHNPIDQQNRFPGAVRTQKYRLVCEISGKAGGSGAVANDSSAKPWQLYDMEIDPAQEKNIAKENPDTVAKLIKLYDAWFADISSQGLQRFPLPVGYTQENPVTLHAPQSFFTGKMHFFGGPGYANDWLTGWEDAKDTLWFDIDVVQPGDYSVEIAYLCPKENAGSKIRVSAGGQSLESEVRGAPRKETPLPHRPGTTKNTYVNMEWATLHAGTLKLGKGSTKLTIEALSKPGAEVMDFKHVRLTRQ
jgi:arylsulfatase A